MDPSAAPTPKQLVVERVRNAQNVLVTVSADPSVDQLAACIGLTLMLNKLDKHATAVFSGAVPSTLEFLRPEETIEKNTDSLRDFIISLDKSKADKLRYKVDNEQNVVRIFITPYRTSLSQSDFEFTQGDFNVDVVIALGVTQREQLDQAIVSHGRILHDAAVVTITSGQEVSELGTVNWQDPAASSLCEMLVSISEAFQGGLLDGQISTAYLTGIVASTDRFSNTKTSPKVMTMAAQLMAAGANQQLIATQLQQTFVPDSAPAPVAGEAPPSAVPDGELEIDHEAKQAEAQPKPSEPEPKDDIQIDEHGTFRLADDGHQHGDDKRPKVITPLNQPPQLPKTDIQTLIAQETGPAAPAGTGDAASDNTQLQPLPQPLPQPLNQPADASRDEPPSPPAADEAGMPAAETALQDPQPSTSEPQLDLPPVSATTPQPLTDFKPADMPVPMPLSEVKPTDTPMPQPDAQPPAAPAPASQDDGSDNHASDPIPLNEMDDKTLLDIEKSVHSPHLEAKPADELESGVDAARDAVSAAITSAPYNADRPEPIQSLNAAPMDLPQTDVPAPQAPPSAPLSTEQAFPFQPFQPAPAGLPGSGQADADTAPSAVPDDGTHPSHGLLPVTPPTVPTENGMTFDPLNTGQQANPSSSAAFDPTAPISPSGSSDQPKPGDPPPVPPPMFPVPPNPQHRP
jgi:nanoRNase/pAp phosphatase (c-di-AMP/oligoRNAs hydrolase)